MDEVTSAIIARYQEKESGSYYDKIQKVTMNPTQEKVSERISSIVLTEEGPKRKYESRKQKFARNKGIRF